MNILIGPLRFVPFAADIPVSLLVAVHFEQRVERLEVGGEIGDVVLQEQGVLLGKGDLQPGEHVRSGQWHQRYQYHRLLYADR